MNNKEFMVEELKKLLEHWCRESAEVERRRSLPVEDEEHASEDLEEWTDGNVWALKRVLELL